MTRTSVTLIGGSGYIGGELLRLLLGHPAVELLCVTAGEHAGEAVSAVHPNLRGRTDLVLARHEDAAPSEITCLSLPHGMASRYLPADGRVIDLSGDFRLADRETYERYYQTEHRGWDRRAAFTTGIPEINRAAIRTARAVAVAGCFATAAILALHPLTRRGRQAGRIVIDGKTGSSGSGAKPSARTHHPVRSTSLFGYEPFHHRHQPEIEQALGAPVLFQPHSTPLVRGVFTTAYVPLHAPETTAGLLAMYEEDYGSEPFIRLQQGSPNVHWVKGANFLDIGVVADGTTAIVFGALDNLIKGGAGQAVQCLNVMLGLDETTGLAQAPGPV